MRPRRSHLKCDPLHHHGKQTPMGKQHHDIGHQKRLRQKRERQLRSELRSDASDFRSLRPRKAGTND